MNIMNINIRKSPPPPPPRIFCCRAGIFGQGHLDKTCHPC